MIAEGQVVLFRFPQTGQKEGKLRPALVIRRLPGRYDDLLICMISSRIRQAIENFDEVVTNEDPDFERSGLKISSVIRISRLAVVERSIFVGTLGEIDPQRLILIKKRLADWIRGA